MKHELDNSNICPICGSTDIDGNVFAPACDECDETLLRECLNCGFKTVGDYYTMDDYWRKGISSYIE